MKDAGELISGGVRVYDRRKSKKAAERLYGLAFTPQGMRAPLQRIAAGEGTKADAAAIEKALAKTAGRVEVSLDKLMKYQKALRESVGWEAADLLNDIVRGPFGKQVTRYRLGEIVRLSKAEPQHLEEIRAEASQIDSDIGRLNDNLQKLHDLILKSGKA
jgi:hypothetical protein